MTERSPEQIARVWSTLEGLAERIADAETRDRYLADWRGRYDEAFPRWLDDATVVRLPDWSHVGTISPQEKRRAARVNESWLDRQAPDPMDADQCRRFAWEVGRRVAAGLIEHHRADEIRADKLGAALTMQAVANAYRRGHDSAAAGEALLAAIALDMRCALLPRTDKGLAQRFRLRHGHDFRHTTGRGWLKWDGTRWKPLEEERGVIPAEILAAVFDTIDAIQREADVVAATGLDEGSVPEWMLDVEDPKERAKLLVEAGEGRVRLHDLSIDEDGMDQLVMTATTCRLLSVVLTRFGRASEDAKRIRCVADLARRWLTVRIQDFDHEPLTINVQNGTLRLLRHVERGEDGDLQVRVEARLDPHRREDLLTKIAAVPYDPDAVCPLYDGTIEWAQPKPPMRRYLHQWGGYNLTGDMGAQIFHVWWGPLAQNGKSTILDAWSTCAGDYSAGGKIETFMQAAQPKSGDAATPALAKLPGVRMLRTGEPPHNAQFDESLINAITGQDPVPVRDNFRSFVEVMMQFKLTVACNEPPKIPNATEGIKRRIKIVPFEQTMKGATKADGSPLRDPDFSKRLPPEMPGIFARLIDGALDWLEHGFAEPDDVTAWTDDYKDDNDPLGRFLAYCTEIDPGARSQSSKLHGLFVAWSKATGGPDWTNKYFTDRLKKKGFSSKASNGVQWLGIRMVKIESDFVDGEGKVIDLSGEGPMPGLARDGPPGTMAGAATRRDPLGDDDDVPF